MTLTRRQILAFSAAMLTTPVRARAAPLVFAAASLKTVLDEIAQTVPMRLNYAGSGALARQILLGAPADIFISANSDWMKVVEDGGRLNAPAQSILSNRLVLITASPNLNSDLTTPPAGRIAMGFTEAVPAGQYGKAALQSLGLWQDTERNIVQTENVRAALALVSRGEVPWGIVYKTDAMADPKVHIAAEFAPETHPTIAYQAGLIKGSHAQQTLADLTSQKSRNIFASHGFLPL